MQQQQQYWQQQQPQQQQQQQQQIIFIDETPEDVLNSRNNVITPHSRWKFVSWHQREVREVDGFEHRVKWKQTVGGIEFATVNFRIKPSQGSTSTHITMDDNDVNSKVEENGSSNNSNNNSARSKSKKQPTLTDKENDPVEQYFSEYFQHDES